MKAETKRALCRHYEEYPKLQLADLHKYIYQSAFGCEHLLSNEEKVIEYIKEEAANCRPHLGEMVEALDGGYCRVYLDWLQKGLSPQTLGKLFVMSACHEEDGVRVLEEKLEALFELISAGELPFEYEEAKKAADNWKKQGYPACRHSEVFREHYGPAYRVIKKEYAVFLPLLAEIDTRLQSGQSVVTVDESSVGDKKMLKKLLSDIYGSTVFCN